MQGKRYAVLVQLAMIAASAVPPPPLVELHSCPCVLDLATNCVCSSNFGAAGACAATSSSDGDYQNGESCEVSFTQRVLLQVHLFDTESGYDKLYVDPSTGGTPYSGTSGPDGVEASALSWRSDSSIVRNGFKVCFTIPPPRPPSPPLPVYTLMNEALSWSDANAACLAAGQHLASVHSAAENALLLTAVAGNTNVWIGGTDAASEGTWVWSPSGTPLSYTNWYPGEPNNGHGRVKVI